MHGGKIEGRKTSMWGGGKEGFLKKGWGGMIWSKSFTTVERLRGGRQAGGG